MDLPEGQEANQAYQQDIYFFSVYTYSYIHISFVKILAQNRDMLRFIEINVLTKLLRLIGT